MKQKIIATLLLLSMLLAMVPFSVSASSNNISSSSVVVSFDTQGGSNIESQNVMVGSTISKPVNPTKDGYLFSGWTYSGQAFDFNTKVTESMTLVATWTENTIPDANIDIETLQIAPGYLEMWNGMTLQLNTVTVGNVTRSDGYKYTRYFALQPEMNFYSLNPSIASVDNKGNVTAKSLGSTYVWAVVTKDITKTFESGNVSVAAGSILAAIEVVVTEEPSYYKLYKSSPQTQQITISSNSQTNSSTFTAIPSTFGSAVVSIWYDDAKNVFTMTCDDNLLGDFEKWNSLLEQTGVPTNFMAPTLNSYYCEDYWVYEVYLGSNVQSHSHYHDSSAEYGDTRTTAQNWADEYYGQLDINNAGIQSLVIGYPCGYNCEFSSILYISGRGTGSGINSFSNTKYNCLQSNSGFGASQAAIDNGFSGYVGAWACVHYHSMGSGYDLLLSNFTKLHELEEAGIVWNTTFSSAAQYGQERDTATVTVTEKNQATGIIKFNLTDKMNDELFYQPLSVKIGLDSTWTSARAYQNGEEVRVQIKKDGNNTYAIVDAIPDAGEVVLVKSTYTINQTENQITITPTNDTYANKMCTVSLPVDFETWNYRVAYQDGKNLETKLTTDAGKTTLDITFDISGGAVLVTPNTGSELKTHTMTQIYGHEVKPSSTIPITISTNEELVLLSNYVNQKNDTTGLVFELTQDLDMSSVPRFTQIGWYVYSEHNSAYLFTSPFSGVFHGNSHTIYGLNVSKTSGTAGLFGYAKGATISDLSVEGTIKGVKFVGGICGNLADSTVSNVTFKGTISSYATGSERNGGSYVGGIAGYISGSTIKNCVVIDTSISVYAAPRISKLKNSYDGFSATATFNSGSGVGGIAGTCNYKPSGTSRIENCEFVGSISAYDYEGEGAEDVGGIVGKQFSCVVTSCFVNAVVMGKANVGGVSGYMYGGQTCHVLNNSFYGTLQGKSTVGGIAGYFGNSSYEKIENCFASVSSLVGNTNVGLVVGLVEASNTKPSVATVYYTAKGDLTPGTAPDGVTFTTVLTNEEDALPLLNQVATSKKYQDWSIDEGKITCVHLPIYKVSFVDADGTVIDTQYVGNGLSATAPNAPWKLGYTFSSWNGSFSSIKGETIITAVYDTIDIVTVTFKDSDGTILIEQKINKGDTAIAPTPKVHDGYVFSKWDKSFENAQEDLTITATYVKGYIVKFYGMNGVLLSTQEVPEGSAAKAPSIPSIDGYHFASWDTDFENVTSTLSVKANYEKNSSSGISISAYALYASGLTGSALTDANIGAVISSSNNADIILLTGVKSLNVSETNSYGCYQYTTTRLSSGGLGYAVLYNKALYSIDTGAEIYASSCIKWTDCGGLAVPLIEKATGKQIVAFSLIAGGNAKMSTELGYLQQAIKLFLDNVSTYYPNMTAGVGVFRCAATEKNSGGLNKLEALNSMADYLSGYKFVCECEQDVQDTITADYLLTIAKTSEKLTAETGSRSATSPLTSIGITASLEIVKATSGGKEEFVVSFMYEDGTPIDVQYVEDGSSAEEPSIPKTRDGKTFIGWDKAYSEIKGNTGIYAIYDYVYTVTFKDNFGNLIKEETVRKGSSVTLPDAPKIEEYKFVSWSNTSLSSIEEDLEVIATYVYNMVTVTFKDNLGNTILEKKVEKGTDVSYPSAPKRYGYLFSSWNIKSISSIQEDTEVLATYVYNMVDVTFKDALGTVLKKETIEKGETLPTYKATAKEGYVFSGWSNNGNIVSSTDKINESISVVATFALNTELFTNAVAKLNAATTLIGKRAAILDVEAVLSLWTEEEIHTLNTNEMTTYEDAKTAYENVVTAAESDLENANSFIKTKVFVTITVASMSIFGLGVVFVCSKFTL